MGRLSTSHLKEAIITSITSINPPSHLRDLGLDPRLDAWFARACESMMADGILRAQADADAHRDVVYADLCAKAESEAKTLAQAHYDQTLARLRNEAELAAHDAVKAAAAAPPIGKSTSSSGRASRKVKASPVVSRPPSRATVYSPTPLHFPPNIPKATTLGMGLDQALPIISSLPDPAVPMAADDTTPMGSPVVCPALVERYSLVVPDSQEVHTPSLAPSSHAAAPSAVCDGSLLDRTAPSRGGIDRSTGALPVARLVAPQVEGATAPPTHSHTTPAVPSEFDRILQALAGISAKVDGVDLRVSSLTSRVSTIEQGRMPSTYDYTGLNDGPSPLPSFDYTAMPVDLEELIARLEDEELDRIIEEDTEVMSLLYANIVWGAIYGDTQANFPNLHPDIDEAYFASVASSWADERMFSLLALDAAGRMDLSKHFWKVARADRKA